MCVVYMCVCVGGGGGGGGGGGEHVYGVIKLGTIICYEE